MDTVHSFLLKHPEYNECSLQVNLMKHWIRHYHQWELSKIRHHYILRLLYFLGILKFKTKEEIIHIWIKRYAKRFRKEYDRGIEIDKL